MGRYILPFFLIIGFGFCGFNIKDNPFQVMNSKVYPFDQFVVQPVVKKGEVLGLDYGATLLFNAEGGIPNGNSQIFRGQLSSVVLRNSFQSNISSQPSSLFWRASLSKTKVANSYSFINVNNEEKRSEVCYYTDLIDYKTELPIISINIDPKDFIGEANGIYVLGDNIKDNRMELNPRSWNYGGNYYQKGKEWEKKVGIEFITDTSRIQYNASIKVNGNATRSFSQKSLLISLEDEQFDFVLPGNNSKCSQFVIRNAGNDWRKTFLRDVVCQEIGMEEGLDGSSNTPFVVLINGHYWGLHYLRNKINPKYVVEKQNINLEDLTFYKDGKLKCGSQSSLDNLLNSLEECNLEKIENKVNIKAFFKYIVVESFFGNNDWPNNNEVFFKIKGKKWKPILNDLDFTMNYDGIHPGESNAFSELMRAKQSLTSKLLTCLIQKKENKNLLIAIAKDFIAKLSFDDNLDSKVSQIKNEMEHQINRWRIPKSLNSWKEDILNLKRFVEKRELNYLTQLNDFLDEHS